MTAKPSAGEYDPKAVELAQFLVKVTNSHFWYHDEKLYALYSKQYYVKGEPPPKTLVKNLTDVLADALTLKSCLRNELYMCLIKGGTHSAEFGGKITLSRSYEYKPDIRAPGYLSSNNLNFYIKAERKVVKEGSAYLVKP